MWDQFFIAYAFGAVALFLPGVLLFKAIGLKWAEAVAAAPLAMCAALPVLAILYGKVGIPCSFANTFLLLVMVGFLAMAARMGIRAKWRKRIGSGSIALQRVVSCRRDVVLLLGFAAFGIIATGYVFVLNLDGAASFVQEYDNMEHLSRIRTFASSGDWSCFAQAYYVVGGDSSIPFALSSNFYPSAWHAFAAMLVSTLGIPVAVSANVVNALFVSLVFPCGIWWLLKGVFGDDWKIVACGILCAFAFAAFPWKLTWWGPIFPNMAALCLFPISAATFIALLRDREPVSRRISFAAVFALGLIAMLLMQPNAVFTCGVFLVPFCIRRIWTAPLLKTTGASSGKARAAVGVAVFSAFVVVVWAFAFNLPIMAPTVEFSWGSFAGKSQAIANVLLLSFRETPAQPVLGALVIVGAAHMIRSGKGRWAVASYAIMCLMYIVSASTDGAIKQVLTGFWYTDPMRLAANAAISGIPLACMGLLVSIRSFAKIFARWCSRGLPSARMRTGSVAFMAMLAAVLLYYPNFAVQGIGSVQTGIGAARTSLEAAYSTSADNVLNPEEREFLQKVQEVAGSELVVNEPNDGSAFAYGISGLNLYYRGFDGYGGSNETEASRLIRLHLNKMGEDPSVRDALDAIGAAYVLQLDQGDDDRSNRYFFTYDEAVWAGIDAVDDGTPGLETVLSEGDMRLYRIV